MSRLDDELRKALRREQPSVDFTTRLLERVAQQPAPKTHWRQRLAMLLDPPKLRWVAIGVTASLLLAIGAAQYGRLHQIVVKDDGTIARNDTVRESGDTGIDTPPASAAPAKSEQQVKIAAPSSGNHRLTRARHRVDRQARADGEAAKEQLMLALSIASSALNDAQKAVHDDRLNP